MKFLLLNVLGAVSLVTVNSMFRMNPWGWPFLLLLLAMVPLTTFGTQMGFGLAYSVAPSFFVAWFVGSAFSNVGALLASVLVFGEEITVWKGLAAGLILLGTYLLLIK